MALLTNLTASWTTAGPFAFACPVQVRRGVVFITWAASAPGNIRDGHMLGSGDTVVVPAGHTIRLAAADGMANEVHYEPYVA